LLGLYNSDLLTGRGSHFDLVLLHFCSINLCPDIHHFPIVFSFHISHLLGLLIFQGQLLVSVLFDMIL